MPRSSATAHALLSLVALRPRWSTYELTGQVSRALRFLLPRAESRVYDEARALARRGLVRAEDDAGGRRPRTVYSLTDQGRAELDERPAGQHGPAAGRRPPAAGRRGGRVRAGPGRGRGVPRRRRPVPGGRGLPGA